eukprot:TRINITY_DN38230_c0_g1_i2.p1 TRINITY_DN38230_c0_g1~~TRINITY_DN38230_c0_g1_i2.p1  ORF type:complete len:288 (+),score=38.96 TRINITY_DN38230_c0_g1_i2:61-924(+)
MGLSDDKLANPDSVSETLRCPICIEVLENPVYCRGNPCQHVFCLACIERALATRQRCPTCRAPARKEQFQPNLLVQSLLDELRVYCKRRQAGCYWSGRQDARAAHEDECLAKQLAARTAELVDKDRLIKEQDEQLMQLGSQLAQPQQSSKLQEGFLIGWGVSQGTAMSQTNCCRRLKISTRYGIIASLVLTCVCLLPLILRRDRHVIDSDDSPREVADGTERISEIPTHLVEHKLENHWTVRHQSKLSELSIFGPAILHQERLHEKLVSTRRPIADKLLHEHRQPKQ